MTVINSASQAIDVTITQNGNVIDQYSFDKFFNRFHKYTATVGDVFTVMADSTVIGTDTYKVPVRCLA